MTPRAEAQLRLRAARAIVGLVCAKFRVSRARFYGSKRERVRTVPARRTAAYLIRKHLHLSYPSIGRLLGGKHHTTVLLGVRTVDARWRTDAKFRARVYEIEEALGV